MVQGDSERGPGRVKCNAQPSIVLNSLGPPLNRDNLKEHSQSHVFVLF
jgi:hypothetical protein